MRGRRRCGDAGDAGMRGCGDAGDAGTQEMRGCGDAGMRVAFLKKSSAKNFPQLGARVR